MDVVQSMKIFVRVVQQRGFAAAARALRLSPAAVTKHVAALEARVGARLLDRTTRRIALTEAGRAYLERCHECLQALDDADVAMSELARAPKGLLRVSAPVDLQSYLGAVTGRFITAHPGVQVELRLTNRSVDLIEEGIDLAVRVAPALDGAFVARPIARARVVFCASPAYLREHGRPVKPEQLAAHRAIAFAEARPMDEWTLERGDSRVRVKLRPALLTNNGEVLRAALLAGGGIGPAVSFVVGADLHAGRLEQLLPQWEVSPSLRVFAVYPHRRFLAPKVRLFVDALRAEYGDGTTDPWWPPGLPVQRSAATTVQKRAARRSAAIRKR